MPRLLWSTATPPCHIHWPILKPWTVGTVHTIVKPMAHDAGKTVYGVLRSTVYCPAVPAPWQDSKWPLDGQTHGAASRESLPRQFQQDCRISCWPLFLQQFDCALRVLSDPNALCTCMRHAHTSEMRDRFARSPCIQRCVFIILCVQNHLYNLLLPKQNNVFMTWSWLCDSLESMVV